MRDEKKHLLSGVLSRNSVSETVREFSVSSLENVNSLNLLLSFSPGRPGGFNRIFGRYRQEEVITECYFAA